MREALRLFLISFSFLCGIVLVILGWLPTGNIWGLATMVLGLGFIIFSLYLYNQKYK